MYVKQLLKHKMFSKTVVLIKFLTYIDSENIFNYFLLFYIVDNIVLCTNLTNVNTIKTSTYFSLEKKTFNSKI